jgi:hypothetical protein
MLLGLGRLWVPQDMSSMRGEPLGDLEDVERDFDAKRVESREHQLNALLVAYRFDEELHHLHAWLPSETGCLVYHIQAPEFRSNEIARHKGFWKALKGDAV